MKWGVLLLVLLLTPFFSVQANHQKTRVEVNIWLHGAPEIQPIKDLELLVGVKFNGAKWYENWDDPWRPHIPNGYHSNGYIPEMTWQPMLKQGDGSFKGVANDDIVSGLYNSYLDTMSNQVKALPYRLRISYAAEFNGGWNPWGMGKVGNTVDNHKTAWRYIVNRFKNNGVTNVDWIWTPNADPFNMTPSYASMYPGDEYVTYFGLDGYNFSTTNGPYWMSFDQVFRSSYNQLQAITNKDVYIMEIGSVEVGGDKAAWIADMFDKLESDYARIKGITWWNVAYPQYDMRIQTSQASIDQFRSSVNGASSTVNSQEQQSTPPTTNKTPSKKQTTTSPIIDQPAPLIDSNGFFLTNRDIGGLTAVNRQVVLGALVAILFLAVLASVLIARSKMLQNLPD